MITILCCSGWSHWTDTFFKIREERAAAARLKLLTAPSFDYFAHVKKSMELSDCETKRSRISATPSFDMDDDDYYKTEKAPMMALLPGLKTFTKIKESLPSFLTNSTIHHLDST